MPTGKHAVAIVFSGGAAKGDFEVGVAQYLLEHKAIKPAFLIGNSVGAINAAKLAEGSGGLGGLVELWRSMRFNTDMYRAQPQIAETNRDVKAAIAAATETLVGGAVGAAVGMFALGPLGVLFGGAAGAGIGAADSDVEHKVMGVLYDVKAMIGLRSLATLDPISKTIHAPGSLDHVKVSESGIKLRLTAVALDDGALRIVDENGAVWERDGSPTTAKVPDPICARPLQQKIDRLEQQLAGIKRDPSDPHGQDAEVAVIHNEIRALQQRLAKCPIVDGQLRVDLRDAVVASCSLPMIFEPVKLGSMWYVDGGMRSICPVEIAVELGASIIYAVVANVAPMQPGRDFLTNKKLPDFAGANFIDVAMRCGADIEPDENLYRDLHPEGTLTSPIVVIRPGGSADLHNAMTIDPGLIDIRMTEGFLRADDIVQAYEQDPKHYRVVAETFGKQRHTAELVDLRHRAWKLEFAAQGWIEQVDAAGTVLLPEPVRERTSPTIPDMARKPDPKALAEVRKLKAKILELAEARARVGGQLPADWHEWFLRFERHSFDFPEIVSFPGPTVELWDSAHPPPKLPTH